MVRGSAAARVYADANAFIPLRPAAKEAIFNAIDKVSGNPSAPHKEGRFAKSLLEDSRLRIADLLGVAKENVVFVASGSEANNLALSGSSRVLLPAASEHPSVLKLLDKPTNQAAQQKSSNKGAKAASATKHANLIGLASNGLLDLDQLSEKIKRHQDKGNSDLGKLVVALSLASGETGIIQPLSEISQLLKSKRVALHSDVSQAVGKIAVDFGSFYYSSATISSHKLGGPLGIAALILSEGARLDSLIVGGSQEAGRRAGTEASYLAAGFAAALEESIAQLDDFARLAKLRDAWEKGVKSLNRDAIIVGQDCARLPNTSCVLSPGLNGEIMVIEYDLSGIALSHSSACSWGRGVSSDALLSMGYSKDLAKSALRVSLCLPADQSAPQRLLEVYRDSLAKISPTNKKPNKTKLVNSS